MGVEGSMNGMNSDLNFTVFFCQQLDPEQDANRRTLERELGSRIRFYPTPCSGRIEPLHLLRALESGADMVFVLTCPQGACRYQQGNVRLRKRLDYSRRLLEEIRLEPGRLEIVEAETGGPRRIDELVRRLLGRELELGPSPLRRKTSP
jgi:F420-non-reducing hydrogenase iron-sulfur subunit